MAVYYNIEGGQHGYLGLMVIQKAYFFLHNTIFVCQFHSGKLSIPILATHHAQETYESSTKQEEWNEGSSSNS